MPEVVGVSPAAVGAEVALPAVFDRRWDLVIADTAFRKAAFVPLRSEGFRILGALVDGWLLMGEVKNMEGVGGPAGLGLGDVAEGAKVLGDLLRDNSALSSALVYNGGRLPGGGKVSSSFMASRVLMFPDLRKIFGQGGVKFVVVAALACAVHTVEARAFPAGGTHLRSCWRTSASCGAWRVMSMLCGACRT